MTTINGCWNCKHGGNLKILRTLLRSIKFEHGILLTDKCKKEINDKINPWDNRCAVDDIMQAETGFVCEKWEYNDCGFQEKV
jgi:hypothetical protein